MVLVYKSLYNTYKKRTSRGERNKRVRGRGSYSEDVADSWVGRDESTEHLKMDCREEKKGKRR